MSQFSLQMMFWTPRYIHVVHKLYIHDKLAIMILFAKRRRYFIYFTRFPDGFSHERSVRVIPAADTGSICCR